MAEAPHRLDRVWRLDGDIIAEIRLYPQWGIFGKALQIRWNRPGGKAERHEGMGAQDLGRTQRRAIFSLR